MIRAYFFICSTHSYTLMELQKKQLSIEYNVAQTDGSTPVDEMSASNKTLRLPVMSGS
jgi:hypothetical protein